MSFNIDQVRYEDYEWEGEGWEDVFSNQILVRVLEEGEGQAPEHGQDVRFSVVGFYQEEGEEGEGKGDEAEPVQFERVEHLVARLGEGDVFPGLELGLRTARTHGLFLVKTMPRFGYAEEGRVGASEEEGSVPPEATLFHVVFVERVCEPSPPLAEMSAEQIMDEVESRKLAGNRHFRLGQVKKAAFTYSRVMQAFDKNTPSTALLEIPRMKRLSLDILNNLAMCYIRMEEYLKAKEVACTSLEIELDENMKGILLAGRVSILLGNFTEAKV